MEEDDVVHVPIEEALDLLVETFWDAAESHLGATVVKLKK
jgi:hypothetical protein